jgi:hypothetical protein
MNNYYYKYIKYKIKYINLKGGFALTQDCNKEPYNITQETDEELNENFLYPEIKKYLTKKRREFNKFLTAINKYSKKNDTPSHSIDDIINFFNNPDHMKLLEELLTKYINDDLENYHVQFSALIFISFILELELFMILYTIISYNRQNKEDNNNIFINWENYENEKIIYDNLLQNDILEIFNIFTCSLELVYKNFINYFVTSMCTDFDKKTIDLFNSNFYKSIELDYRHIQTNWVNNLNEHLNITIDKIKNKLNKTLRRFTKKEFYDPNALGLFDYIFYKKYHGSCITFSILEFYLLSRLHIKYEDLYLDLESESDDTDYGPTQHSTIREYTNTQCTHWTCTFMNTKTRSDNDAEKSFSFKNKAEILFSFIFVIYDRYIDYKPFINNYDKEEIFQKFIEGRQKFLNTILFTSKPIIISSMKINPINTWNYIKDKDEYINDIDIIIEAIRYDIINFYSLYYKDQTSKQLYKTKQYILPALESKQIKYNYIKDPELSSDREIIMKAVTSDGLVLQYLSDALRNNPEIVKIAVEQNGLALEFASDNLKDDQDIVKIAVEQNGLALEFASDNLKDDRNIVKIALEQNSLALQHASYDRRNSVVADIKSAITKNGLAFQYMTESLRTRTGGFHKTLLITAVTNNGLALEFTNETFKDDENIVKTAVTNNGLALQYANERFRDNKEIVKTAVANNGLALQFANERFRNDENIVKTAVENNGLALQFANERFRDNKEIVKMAVENNGLALQYTNETLRGDKEFIKIFIDIVREHPILKNDELVLSFISEELRDDKEIIDKAIEHYGLSTIQYASERLKDTFSNDKKFIKEAIDKGDEDAFKYASEELKNDPEFVKEVIELDYICLEYADENLRNNPEIVQKAFEQSNLALIYASETLKNDPEFVMKVIKQDINALEFVNDKFKYIL